MNTTPGVGEIVNQFDTFLEQYTGKHEETFDLAKILFADTVRVRKDLIVKQFREVITTLTIKHQEEIEKTKTEERIRCYDVAVRLANREAVSVDNCQNIVVLPKDLFVVNLSMALSPTKTDKQTEV